MFDFLKLMSLLTGSSPETLLNAKAEVQNILGVGQLSDRRELKIVVETLMDDMVRIFDPTKASRLPMYELLGIMIEDHVKRKDYKFIQIFNRVLVYYYYADFNDQNALMAAIVRFSNDFEDLIYEFSCDDSSSKENTAENVSEEEWFEKDQKYTEEQRYPKAAQEGREAEKRRRAEEQRRAEERRIAEQRRRAEEQRRAEERRIAEQRRRAEEQRRAEERRIAEKRRRAEEQRRAEERRIAEQRRRAEEQRQAEERRIAEIRRKLIRRRIRIALVYAAVFAVSCFIVYLLVFNVFRALPAYYDINIDIPEAMAVGESIEVKLTYSTLPLVRKPAIKLKTSNHDIAFPNDAGELEALKEGNVTVEAIFDGEVAISRPIIIEKPEIDIKVLSLIDKTLCLSIANNPIYDIRAEINTNLVSKPDIAYISDNPEVAEVSSFGYVKAISAGTANIIMKAGAAEERLSVIVDSGEISDFEGIKSGYFSQTNEIPGDFVPDFLSETSSLDRSSYYIYLQGRHLRLMDLDDENILDLGHVPAVPANEKYQLVLHLKSPIPEDYESMDLYETVQATNSTIIEKAEYIGVDNTGDSAGIYIFITLFSTSNGVAEISIKDSEIRQYIKIE